MRDRRNCRNLRNAERLPGIQDKLKLFRSFYKSKATLLVGGILRIPVLFHAKMKATLSTCVNFFLQRTNKHKHLADSIRDGSLKTGHLNFCRCADITEMRVSGGLMIARSKKRNSAIIFFNVIDASNSFLNGKAYFLFDLKIETK